MNKYTWNIIYLNINIDLNTDQDKGNREFVVKSIECFKTAIGAIGVSDNINITTLEFVSEHHTGKAESCFSEIGSNGEVMLTGKRSIEGFDCYVIEKYSSFFSEIYKQRQALENQKYIVVFSAHSFGAGFFRHQMYRSSKYFSVKMLNKAIMDGFKDQKLDALIFNSCYLQTMEANKIFAGSTTRLIASEEELRYDMLAFEFLFKAIGKGTFSVDDIFKDFIDNSLEKHEASHKEEDRYFNVAITFPLNVFTYFKEWGHLTTLINTHKVGDSVIIALTSCVPIKDDGGLPIFDGKQVIEALKKTLADNTIIMNSLDRLLKSIKSIIADSVCSPNHMVRFTDNKMPITPIGVGIWFKRSSPEPGSKVDDSLIEIDPGEGHKPGFGVPFILELPLKIPE